MLCLINFEEIPAQRELSPSKAFDKLNNYIIYITGKAVNWSACFLISAQDISGILKRAILFPNTGGSLTELTVSVYAAKLTT